MNCVINGPNFYVIFVEFFSNRLVISYNSYVKFHDIKFGSHNMTMFYPNMCKNTIKCFCCSLCLNTCTFYSSLPGSYFQADSDTLLGADTDLFIFLFRLPYIYVVEISPNRFR